MVQWISGRPPLAVPLCGFHGEKCRPLPGITQSQPATTLTISDDGEVMMIINVDHETNTNWPKTQISRVCKNVKTRKLLSFTVIINLLKKQYHYYTIGALHPVCPSVA